MSDIGLPEAASIVDDIVRGIDYLLGRSESFGGSFGNALRVQLHGARQTAVTISEQQAGTAPSAQDVEQGTPATGALGAANYAGTGSGPQAAVDVPASPSQPVLDVSLTDAAQAPPSIPQEAWNALPADARAAILADAGKGSPTPPQAEQLPQGDADSSSPPWAPADGAQAAS